MNEIHIGEIIRKKLKENGMKVTDFAKALHYNRNNAYSIFNRKKIDLELLTLISEILGCDLLEEYTNNNSKHKNIFIIEITDDLKMKEIQSDSLIKILLKLNA